MLVKDEKLKALAPPEIEEIKEGNYSKSKSKSVRLVNLILSKDIKLIHDRTKRAFAKIKINDHYEIHGLQSSIFKNLISQMFWDENGETLTSNDTSSATNILTAMSCHGGEEVTLNCRMARVGENIWYDLTNKEWQAIEITKEGWEKHSEPPVIFKRQGHQHSQLDPTRGDPWKILDFFNIEEDQKLLLMVVIISYFIPDIPHPILLVHGEKGAAKSTLFRIIRAIVDPSATPTITMPEKVEDMIIQFDHNWVIPYDNIHSISNKLSDILCQAVTGQGFSKRKLYTDDEEIIFSFKRCIMLNGINNVGKNPDLLDRSVIVQLNRIEDGTRREESDIYEELKEKTPGILGGIFDTISKTLSIIGTINLEKLPRMADFAKYGSAISIALGKTQEEFLEIYNDNIMLQNEALMDNDTFFALIKDFMDKQIEIEATPTALFESIFQQNEDGETDWGRRFSSLEKKYLPNNPISLSRKLNEIKSNLKMMGVNMSTRKVKLGRLIKLEKVEVENNNYQEHEVPNM